MDQPFEVIITNISEIRMGSPYNTCKIELVGIDRLAIPKNGWQDKYAWSEDSKKLVLISWDFEKNEPGFNLFFINVENGTIEISNKIFGLINTISISKNQVLINKFLYDKQKSKVGELCCNIDEVFNLKE